MAVEASTHGLCALDKAGKATCWGRNEGGIPLDGTFTEVVRAFGFACGLKESGEVACAGANSLSFDPPSGQFKSVTIRGDQLNDKYMACALNMSDQIQCWGDVGSEFSSPSTKFASIEGNCGLRKSDNHVVCWSSRDGSTSAFGPGGK